MFVMLGVANCLVVPLCGHLAQPMDEIGCGRCRALWNRQVVLFVPKQQTLKDSVNAPVTLTIARTCALIILRL